MAKVTRKPGPGRKLLDVAIKDLKGVRGKVGWFETAHYPNGVPVAYVAAIQEFGYPAGGIPPRLGMRETAAAQRKEWGQIAFQSAKAILKGTTTAMGAMELLGLKAAGDFRKHISEVWTPSLKEATILNRAYDRNLGYGGVTSSLTKPLVFSGHLLTTLTNTTEKTT